MTMLVVFMLVFLTLILLRVPVAISIAVGGLAGYTVGSLNMNTIPAALTAGLDSFSLLAVPAFIFAGDLMAQGGISSAIISFLYAIFKRFRGCLGSVLVITSMLFGSITGSSLATVSAIGGIMVPEMLKTGYDKNYTTALLASAGFLGILIPPSVPGVMYAIVTEQKVMEVWLSTLVPGIVLGILYMFVNYFLYGTKQPQSTEKRDLKQFGQELLSSTPKAVVAFIMPVIIFGGVYGGVFTATEAGAISVLYGLLAGWVIYPLLFKNKPEIGFIKTAKMSAISSATIGLLIAMATIIGRMMAMGGIAVSLTNFLMSVTSSKYVFIILVNILLIIAGMFLETNTSILLFAPILVPIAQAYGYHPVHFGAILLLNLEIGLITPPFAANLFVSCKIVGTTIDNVIKPLLPFYAVCFIVLMITTFFPEFSMFFIK